MKKSFLKNLFLIAFLLIGGTVSSQNYQLLYQNFNLPLSTSLNNTAVGSSVGPNKWIINNLYSGLSIYPNTISQDSTYIGQITGAPYSDYLHIYDSGNGASQGIFNCSYDPSVTSDNFTIINTDGVCTLGADTVYFSFFYTCQGDTTHSYGELYYSKNSGPWIQTGLAEYVNKTLWKYEVVADPAFNNAADLRFGFRWVNNSSVLPVRTAMGIDDVQIVAHYDSLSTAAITLTTNVLDDTICAGTNFLASFTFSDTLCDGFYNVELSDYTGDFTVPMTLYNSIGLFYPQTNFLFSLNMPTSLFPGNCYRLRIRRVSLLPYPPVVTVESGCFTVIQCPNTVTTLQPIVTQDTNAVCAGSVIDVPFWSTGVYNVGNSYIAQLSDINGNFPMWPQTGTELGNFFSMNTYDPNNVPNPGNVAGLIPDTVSPGCNYYVRVIATNPFVAPIPTLGFAWGPFCVQHCDIITNNEQDIHMCINPPQDSSIFIPVNVHFYNNTQVYSPGNQYSVQLISRGPFPPPMTEVGLPGVLGNITATNDANVQLTIHVDSLAAWGINAGSYYLRIVANNTSVPENSLGSLIRFTFGNPASTAPTVTTFDYPSLTPLTNDSVCMGDYIMFVLNQYHQNSTYNWQINSQVYSYPPNSFLVWANGAVPFTVRVRENSFGCLGPLSPPIAITVLGPPNVNITGPTNVCVGDTVQYTVLLGSTFYLWSVSGGTILSNGSNHAQMVFNTPGTDTVYVNATNDCFSNSSFKVVNVIASPPVPVITQSADTLICSVSGGVTYRWYRNNVLQPQYTTQMIVITSAESGMWEVEVRNIAPPYCNATSSSVEIEVGINEWTNNSGIIITPNPVTNQITIYDVRFTIEKIEILDALGQYIFRQRPETGNQQIDVSFLAPGIYFVKVFSGEKIFTKRLVKM